MLKKFLNRPGAHRTVVLAALNRIEQRLVMVAERLKRFQETMEGIRMTLDELQAQVTVVVGVEASAAALLGGIKARLDEVVAELAAAGADPAKVQAISDELGAATEGLAAAVSANTPA